MELKESPDRGVYVKDLSQFVCKNYEEMNKVLKASERGRVARASAQAISRARAGGIRLQE
jgi:hypothetical protein